MGLGNKSAISLSLAALLFVFGGRLRIAELTQPGIVPLLPEGRGELFPLRHAFADNAVFPGVVPPRIGAQLVRVGSWVGGDPGVGDVRSAWFPAVPNFALQIAGYPIGHGCELYLEAESKNGSIARLNVAGDENPTELWHVREISFAAHPEFTRFRIVGIDHSTQPGGWIGVSEPFRFLRTPREFFKEAGQMLLAFLTAAAMLVALLVPGLCWKRCFGLNLVWLPLPGFLLLAALGLLCWIVPPVLSVRHCAQIGLIPFFAFALYHSIRFPLSSFTSAIERRVFGICCLLVCLCVAYTSYSPSATGELFAGRISRTFAVSDRSDSRIPFHVLQLIAHHDPPYGALAARLWGDWGFSARTPLVALAASPLVLTLPVEVPAALPDENWTIFDPEGFAAFRIAMMTIACASLVSVFGFALLFLDEASALLAFFVTATAPFVVHEIYFTWPKLEAAWFLLLAAYLLLRRRALLAGLLWGIAYLCHPLALVFAPALLGVAAASWLKSPDRKPFTLLRQVSALIPGVASCVGFWVTVNRPNFQQTRFLSYFTMADGAYSAAWPAWLISRFDSLANTLIPLFLFFVHPHDHANRAWFGTPPRIVTFYLQYWNTLPFAVGIGYFFFLLLFCAKAFKHARSWLLLVIVVPFLCFTAYWGFSSGGILREGLQPWVLGLLIFSVILWRRSFPWNSSLSRLCRFALLLRGAETLLMMLHPVVATSRPVVTNQFFFGDLISLLLLFAAVFLLYRLPVVPKMELGIQRKPC